jgi:hypothetical protein
MLYLFLKNEVTSTNKASTEELQPLHKRAHKNLPVPIQIEHSESCTEILFRDAQKCDEEDVPAQNVFM